MEGEPKPRLFQKEPSLSWQDKECPSINFLAPSAVVERALSVIQPDGTVMDFDHEVHKWLAWEPYEPIDTDSLAPDNYATKLRDLAYGIFFTVNNIAMHPDDDDEVRRLAHWLTAYRHDRRFIALATSLVGIDEHGALLHPRLPADSPWHWVPRIRAQFNQETGEI